MENKIMEAKARLYSLLLELDEKVITDIESEIMYLLSKDQQVQSLIKTTVENDQLDDIPYSGLTEEEFIKQFKASINL